MDQSSKTPTPSYKDLFKNMSKCSSSIEQEDRTNQVVVTVQPGIHFPHQIRSNIPHTISNDQLNPTPIILSMANATAPTCIQSRQQVIMIGNCPSCKIGNLHEDWDTCGVLCALCCFPVGVLCCFMMSTKRCSHYAATYPVECCRL